jgi:hypothetical protein
LSIFNFFSLHENVQKQKFFSIYPGTLPILWLLQDIWIQFVVVYASFFHCSVYLFCFVLWCLRSVVLYFIFVNGGYFIVKLLLGIHDACFGIAMHFNILPVCTLAGMIGWYWTLPGMILLLWIFLFCLFRHQ